MRCEYCTRKIGRREIVSGIDRRFKSKGNLKKDLLKWLISKHPEYLGEAITVITPLHHTVYAFEQDNRGYYLECQS